MERFIGMHFLDHLSFAGCFGSSQFAYRKFHGARDALLYVILVWLLAFEDNCWFDVYAAATASAVVILDTRAGSLWIPNKLSSAPKNTTEIPDSLVLLKMANRAINWTKQKIENVREGLATFHRFVRGGWISFSSFSETTIIAFLIAWMGNRAKRCYCGFVRYWFSVVGLFCYAGPFAFPTLILMYMQCSFSKQYESGMPFNTGAGGGTADYAFVCCWGCWGF